MPVCIGPCCIPVEAFFPLVLLFIKPIYDWLRNNTSIGERMLPEWKGGKGQLRTKAEGCCGCEGQTVEGELGGGGEVIEVVSIEHWDKLLRSAPLVIVDFTAKWCKPCQKMAPTFDALASKYAAVTFVKVDIDALKDVAEDAEVLSLPTFQVWREGERVDADVVVGAREDLLTEVVERHCEAAKVDQVKAAVAAAKKAAAVGDTAGAGGGGGCDVSGGGGGGAAGGCKKKR